MRPGTLKITLPILRRHLAVIDRAAVEMRLRHGVVVSRSQIIGALIELHLTKMEQAAKRKGV